MPFDNQNNVYQILNCKHFLKKNFNKNNNLQCLSGLERENNFEGNDKNPQNKLFEVFFRKKLAIIQKVTLLGVIPTMEYN